MRIEPDAASVRKQPDITDINRERLVDRLIEGHCCRWRYGMR